MLSLGFCEHGSTDQLIRHPWVATEMVESRLSEKRQKLIEERTKATTPHERKLVIDMILKGIERDMDRLGITKEDTAKIS
jgi:hypothetical protein